jgi:hypothetical protein
MNPALMTVDANGDEVVGMVTLDLSPFMNMMHVHLNYLRLWFVADSTPIPVTPLDELTDGVPSFAPVFFPASFPVRRLITCKAIGWIVLAGSGFETFHCLWTWLVRWIQLWVISAVLTITRIITKLSGCVTPFASINFAAIRANHFNLVFPVTGSNLGAKANRAFSGTEETDFFIIGQSSLISITINGLLMSARVAGNSHIATIITPFSIMTNALKRLFAMSTNLDEGHVTPPVCLAPGVG